MPSRHTMLVMLAAIAVGCALTTENNVRLTTDRMDVQGCTFVAVVRKNTLDEAARRVRRSGGDVALVLKEGGFAERALVEAYRCEP